MKKQYSEKVFSTVRDESLEYSHGNYKIIYPKTTTDIKDTEQKKGDVYQTIISINTVLGLGLEKAHARSIDHIHISDEVRALADARAIAKQNKDFATSDALRDQIRAYGYDVEDRPNGQEIVKK